MTGPLTIDMTAVVLTGLRTEMEGRFVTETPADLVQALPVGQVIRNGGGDDGIVLDTATMTILCFAATSETSRTFGYSVVAAMYALRGRIINGAVITDVRKIGGPVPLPYDNPAVRRQALTFRVAGKPA